MNKIEIYIIATLTFGLGYLFFEKLKTKDKLNNKNKTIADLQNKLIKVESNKSNNKEEQLKDSDKVISSIKNAISQCDKIISNTSTELNKVEKEISESTKSTGKIIESIESVGDIVKELVDPIKKFSELSKHTTEIEKNVNELSQTIKDILVKSNEVTDISFQAKLLAFNASVEAARANEAGKGFAVVADEVGKFAKRSQISSEEISSLVEKTSRFTQTVQEKTEIQITNLENINETTSSTMENSIKKIKELELTLEQLRRSSESMEEKLSSFSSVNNTGLESLQKLLSDCVGAITGGNIEDLEPSDVVNHLHNYTIIDVRREDEFYGELGHIKNAILMTLQDNLDLKLENLDKDKEYLFVCRSGGRSSKAARIALGIGMSKIYNLNGGMLKWNQLNYPIEKTS